MGVKGGPNISFLGSLSTILDPSSNILYPGTGFTFSNPFLYKGASDWTMTDNTNLIAGVGVSKYVKQTSKQQFSQRVVQVLSGSSDKYSLFFSYKVAKTGTDSTIMQIQSNNLTFSHSAAGELTMSHQNTNYTTSGLAMTDDAWRFYTVTRSGTAATLYVNGSIHTTFTGISANNTSAGDTKVFDYIGCDGAIGFINFSLGQVFSSQQVKNHYDAFKGRFRLS